MIEAILLAMSGAAAGVFGALLGLGGGILIVPILTLGFGLGFREAVAVSLLAVITTSSAGAAVYLQRRVANLRLGMTLELATAIGGLVGGLVAFALDQRLLSGVFALMLAYVAVTMLRRGRGPEPVSEPPAIVEAGTPGSFEASLGGPGYSVRRLPLGLALSLVAGLQSALLGVGGGTIKVPAMHVAMGAPLRVAAATSNVMIGITASASAVLYLLRGAVDPYVAGPVVVGVFVGASVASRLASRVPINVLRLLFVVVLGYVAIEMGLRAFGISLLGRPT